MPLGPQHSCVAFLTVVHGLHRDGKCSVRKLFLPETDWNLFIHSCFSHATAVQLVSWELSAVRLRSGGTSAPALPCACKEAIMSCNWGRIIVA